MSIDGVTERLSSVAADQDGYFTAAQALDAGLDTASITTHVAAGTFARIETDLLRLAGWPRHELDEYSKWCAWLGVGAAISHHSAADLHGLGSLRTQFIHVRIAGTVRAHDSRLAIHRGRIRDDDVDFTGAFRVTTPTRTVLDLAASGISQAALDEVVTDGLAIGRVGVDELFERAVECGDRVAERVEAALR